jgi:hypothetical protein
VRLALILIRNQASLPSLRVVAPCVTELQHLVPVAPWLALVLMSCALPPVVAATLISSALEALIPEIFDRRVLLQTLIFRSILYLGEHHRGFCQSLCGCLLLPLLRRYSQTLSLSLQLSHAVDHWHRRPYRWRPPMRFPYVSLRSCPIRSLCLNLVLILHLQLRPGGSHVQPLSAFRLVCLVRHRCLMLLGR